MKTTTSLLTAIACFFCATSFALAQHTGPKYGALPQGAVYDNNSRTEDIARGGPPTTVRWTDRLNKKHVVTLKPNESVTVTFPIMAGDWVWFQNDKDKPQQRTGFNQAVTWVEATFSYEPAVIRAGQKMRDPAIKIISSGYRTTPADKGILGDILTTAEDIQKISAIGVKVAEDVTRIAKAAGMKTK